MDNELHKAIKNGQIPKVKELLQKGADINSLNGMKGTPLCTAIYTDKPEIVDFLLLQPLCDINAKDFDGEPPLCLAIRMGLYDLAEKLINMASCDVNKTDPVTMKKPLHIAVDQKSISTVQSLISRKCSLNAWDQNGNSALHAAVISEQNEIAKYLVEAGCDLYTYNYKGHSPLHSAVVSNNVGALRLLIEVMKLKSFNLHKGDSSTESDVDFGTHGFGESPLFLAIRYENMDMICELLKYKCDINLANNEAETPLFTACKLNYTDIAVCLLDAGASPDKVSKELQHKHNYTQSHERPSIHQATLLGNLTIVRKLLKCGGDINIQDSLGYTPLHFALVKNKPDIASYLIDVAEEKGLDVNRRTRKDENVLFAVASCVEPEKFAERLIALGCDINHISHSPSETRAPLDVAVEMNCIPLVEILLENGANLDSTFEHTEMSPLHYCAEEDQVGVASALIQWGADLNLADSDGGSSPLALAVYATNMDMAALLLYCGSDADMYIINDPNDSDFLDVDISECPELLEQFKYRCTHPLRLTFLCRAQITTYFRKNRISLKRCSNLPLPKNLVDFVRFKNLDKYKYAPIPNDLLSDLAQS